MVPYLTLPYLSLCCPATWGKFTSRQAKLSVVKEKRTCVKKKGLDDNAAATFRRFRKRASLSSARGFPGSWKVGKLDLGVLAGSCA